MSGFGICDLTVAPLRSSPDDRSEMVSQVLFGEVFEILEQKKNWLRIQTQSDHYSGWMDEKQFQPVSLKVFRSLQEEESPCSLNYLSQAKSEFRTVHLSLGSSLPFYDGKNFSINGEIFQFNAENTLHQDANKRYALLPGLAKSFLETPYLWGGRSTAGVDCSGFVNIIFKTAGIQLFRDAWQQSEQGSLIHFVNDAEPGDLAFFDNEEGKITHVGMIVHDHQIIHASGKVRIDTLDHYGIYNEALKKYSHKLRLIRRMMK